jgi:UDP-N-acetylmuramoyl-tripeptide--D-alanyl-D-alanine ligase
VTFTLAEIAAAVRGEVVRGAPDLRVAGVSTDSRTALPGDLFVALRGPRFDGHAFLAAAAERGAAAALVARDALPVAAELPLVAAEDTLRALGDLAARHRRRCRAEVVGVTGSAGKTTTKEMAAAILSRRGPTLRTRGNLNNLIGLPLTVFGLGPEHRYAVLEMGMSRLGEIARLAEIARPNVGVVTNVAAAHTAGVGGIEGVARAKGELFAALGEADVAAVNLDDPRIAALRPGLRSRVVTFGRQPAADVRLLGEPAVSFAGTRARVRVGGAEVEIALPQIGVHQVENALAAMAVSHALGIPAEEMPPGLAATEAVAGRMTVRQARGVTLLDDTYNANPRSVAMALETLAALAGGGRAVAVLGDMLELGEESAAEHREVGRLAARRCAALFAFGPEAAQAAAGAREAGLAEVFHSADAEEMAQALRASVRAGDVVLVKGSRGMRMERIVEALGGAAEVH